MEFLLGYWKIFSKKFREGIDTIYILLPRDSSRNIYIFLWNKRAIAQSWMKYLDGFEKMWRPMILCKCNPPTPRHTDEIKKKHFLDVLPSLRPNMDIHSLIYVFRDCFNNQQSTMSTMSTMSTLWTMSTMSTKMSTISMMSTMSALPTMYEMSTIF